MMSKRLLHFTNGNIYASSGRQTSLKTDLLVDRHTGSVVEVWGAGEPKPAAAEVADEVEQTDLEGKLVLPGFHDSHIHVMGLGKMLSSLDLRATSSMTEFKEKLREYAANMQHEPTSKWIVGFGWDQDLMCHGYPSRWDLDEVVPDRPVLLLRVCTHIGVVNSAALRAAEITRDSQSPEGGAIDKNEDGEPTGILRECALDRINSLIIDDRETMKRYLEMGLNYCVSVGLTAVHSNDQAPAWQLYRELQQEGKMPIRVYLTTYYHDLDKPDIPAPMAQEGMLQCHRVKIIVDGSLGAETAALRKPYVGKTSKGLLAYPRPVITSMVKNAHALGYRLEVHAIGDEAAEAVLQAFEQAGLTPEDRPILTHCQILGKDLIDLMARLGVIADVQPQFVTTDSLWIDKRLEPELLPYCYAWKTMISKGIPVAGGSDAPIELPDPFLGLYAAIYRYDSTGKQSWREEERLTFDEALHIYTHGGAFTAKQETQLGSLEKGKKADFVVVASRVDLDPTLLSTHAPEEVWVDGQLKWTHSMGRQAGRQGKTCSC